MAALTKPNYPCYLITGGLETKHFVPPLIMSTSFGGDNWSHRSNRERRTHAGIAEHSHNQERTLNSRSRSRFEKLRPFQKVKINKNKAGRYVSFSYWFVWFVVHAPNCRRQKQKRIYIQHELLKDDKDLSFLFWIQGTPSASCVCDLS